MAYEGPRIFRAPCVNSAAFENFQNTVLEGLPLEEVRRYTDDPLSEDETVFLWGASPANDGSWGKIDPGDYLIFYRDEKYTYSARVLGTERNDELAREAWPNFEDEPWDRIIYLAAPNEINVPSAEIHDLAGYDRTHTQGFSSLNDMGTGGIRGKYGSVEAFAEGTGDDTELGSMATQAEPEFDLDTTVLNGLYFPDGEGEEILEQVEAAFAAGKHVVFTGPPGTGKTELARRVCEELVETNPEIYSGHQTTTATADWSTFETVGGYMPSESDEELTFEPGQVLRRFKHDGEQRNDLLVIDEINRADIDKSFGQLFTLLSGQSVQLPYRRNGEEIVIRQGADSAEPPEAHEYVMPAGWRLLATMNTYDKTSLYELSYAFMRRFSFVHVSAPTIPANADDAEALLREYVGVWGMDSDEDTVAAVAQIWRRLNSVEDGRKIGPAIVRDMLRGIDHGPHRDHEQAVTAAVANYVLPQLEGVKNRTRIVGEIAAVDAVDPDRLDRLAGDVLGVTIDG